MNDTILPLSILRTAFLAIILIYCETINAQFRTFQLEAGIRAGLFVGSGISVLYTPVEFITLGIQSNVETANHTRFAQIASSTYFLANLNFYRSRKKEFKAYYLQAGAGYSAVRPYNYESDRMGWFFSAGLGSKRKRVNSGFFIGYHQRGFINGAIELTYSFFKPKIG
jgi:hypothetical protein